MAWIPRDFWDLSGVKHLDPAQRYLAARLLDTADAWGRVPVHEGALVALADMAGVSDEEVDAFMAKAQSRRRPLLLVYGRWAQIVGFDSLHTARFLLDRSEPEGPEPPLEVWRRADCNRRCRANRKGEILEGLPGWYPDAGDLPQCAGNTAPHNDEVRLHTKHVQTDPVCTTNVCSDHNENVQSGSDGTPPMGTRARNSTQLNTTQTRDLSQRERSSSRALIPPETDPPEVTRERRPSGWVGDVQQAFAEHAPAVVAAVTALAERRGFGVDPELVYATGERVLRAAKQKPHFGFALAEFIGALARGEVGHAGNAPWAWINVVADNGPRKAREPTKTTRRPILGPAYTADGEYLGEDEAAWEKLRALEASA